MGGRAAQDVLERMHRQADIFGMQLELLDRCTLQCGDPADAGDGQLVGAVAAMHQPGAGRSKCAQGFGHGADQVAGKCAGQLVFDTGGVGQRPEDVEDGPCAKFRSGGHHMGNCRVVHGRHHEADSDLFQRLFNHLHADHHVDSHLRQRIRRAGFRTEVAVAVLGHHHARARHHKGRGGRDVQRALAVAPRSDDVHGPFGRAHLVAFGPHHGGGGGVFVHRLAAGAQGHQQAADLAWRGFAVEQDGKGGLRLGPAQRAVRCGGDQRFQGVTHAGTFIADRKFCNRAWPCSEAMDSGWNCNPWIGNSRCCRPMMVPSASVAVISRQSGRVARSTTSE